MPVCLECLRVVGKTGDREGGMVRDGTKWTCRLITLRVDSEPLCGMPSSSVVPYKASLTNVLTLYSVHTYLTCKRSLNDCYCSCFSFFLYKCLVNFSHSLIFYLFFLSFAPLCFNKRNSRKAWGRGRGDWSRANGWM